MSAAELLAPLLSFRRGVSPSWYTDFLPNLSRVQEELMY